LAGFVLSLREYPSTIPTLWDTVKEFMELYPHHLAQNNSLEWLSIDGGDTYNLCHFVRLTMS
jgi:alpha 1,2-mannosyltransferase